MTIEKYIFNIELGANMEHITQCTWFFLATMKQKKKRTNKTKYAHKKACQMNVVDVFNVHPLRIQQFRNVLKSFFFTIIIIIIDPCL